MVLDRGVEQLVARWAHNPKVGGSSPPSATKYSKAEDFHTILCFFYAINQSNNFLLIVLFLLSKHLGHSPQISTPKIG